jgi:peptidoglycan/xylan/chitin deacetylase (PgdA/CDA1 family)
MAGMLIGSHGVAHRDWTRLNRLGLRHELIAARMTLEEICRRPVEAAAIPFGRYNAAVLRALRATGYNTVYSSDRGPADPAAFLKPRTSIRQDTTEAELERILSGRLPLLRKMRRDISMRVKRLS